MGMVNIFWFRRDLRLDDNAGLYRALRAGLPVLPVFIFDSVILDRLDDKRDARVGFIHASLQKLREELAAQGSGLEIFHGTPAQAFAAWTAKYSIASVYANADYEPYARERDAAVAASLAKSSIGFHSFKDQVIFDRDEVLKDDGTPYTIFTPYSRKWKAKWNAFYGKSYPVMKYARNFLAFAPPAFPSLAELGFEPGNLDLPPVRISDARIRAYADRRDVPAEDGTTHLGPHLRFGTVSIRVLARRAEKLSAKYLDELIWRDFYHMILWHFPQVGRGKSFKPEYDRIRWRDSETDFQRWCAGLTGYPIVDAGMRQLNQTGFMHNRVRMIVASFLAKHLLIDWRWGEAYFAEKLLDFDLASNNGGWQWAAGCGCDAAPYFRVFNPTLQTKKFDPDLRYIRRWVPELDELTYPLPMVEHEFARKRALDAYAKALKH